MSDAGVLPARVRIVATVDELLSDAERREPWKNADSLSGSHLERLTIGGEPFVAKFVCVDDDWIMRGTGDLNCRQLSLLTSTALDNLPPTIVHTITACAPFTSARGHRGAVLLMRDVSPAMVRAGSCPIALDQHRQFLDHMAQMHAANVGFNDGGELFPLAHHYVFLTPAMAALETATGRADPVPIAVRDGWVEMARVNARQADCLLRLAENPAPLLAVLSREPQTLIHGDWKLGNLGSHPDGRTILLDWDRTGAGSPLIDLAWYVAVNCDRLPESKEDTIATYRVALEGHGVATGSWWDLQLAAALAGAFLQLGWAKTGDPAEFSWWSERLDAALPLL